MSDDEETNPIEEGTENVAEDLSNTVAPGSVVANVEPIIEEIREGFHSITDRLDALTAAQPPSEQPPGTVEEVHEDESPVKPPWTHRRLFGKDNR